MNKYIILALIVILSASCNDMFDADPDNSFSEDRLWVDAAFAEGLLINAYAYMPLGYDWDEAATDDAVSNVQGNNYSRMAQGEWSSLFNPMDKWQTAYNRIADLNDFLEKVDRVQWSRESEERDSLFRERFRGEALALRGYYHFLILVNHGGPDANGEMLGVPYVTQVIDPQEKEQWNLPRPSYKETVEEIFTDLREANRLLPEEYADITGNDSWNRVNGKVTAGRISATIVKAIMTKVALHAASPAYNGGVYDHTLLQLAADTAYMLIEKIGGVAALNKSNILNEPYFFALNNAGHQDIMWRPKYETSYEWEKANFPPSREGNGEVNPSQNLVNTFPMANGYPINHPMAGYNPNDPYSNRDPRLENMIYYNGSPVSASSSDKNILNVADDPKNAIGKQTNSTRTGYYLRKPLRTDVSITTGAEVARRHFRAYIRYTEIFLIYAEAANELWGPAGDPRGYGYDAKTVISELRRRAKITNAAYVESLDKKGMEELIRNERRIELCFEGYRFWDIRRWNLTDKMRESVLGVKATRISPPEETPGSFTYEEFTVESRNYQDYMLYGPVPKDQLLKCDRLTQNKGWE